VKVTATALPEVKLIEPRVFGDDRGFFYESWNARAFADAGLELDFVQDNHSRSARGVLRGLHYQVEQAQGKLVRVVHGAGVRRRRRPAALLTQFRPLGGRGTERGQQADAVGAAGFRPWLPCARGRHRIPLQMHRFLRGRA
jgi:hypothetical protein